MFELASLHRAVDRLVCSSGIERLLKTCSGVLESHTVTCELNSANGFEGNTSFALTHQIHGRGLFLILLGKRFSQTYFIGTGETAFPEELRSVPRTHPRQLTAAYNSRSGGSNTTLVWPPRGAVLILTHTYVYTCTHKHMKSLKKKLK